MSSSIRAFWRRLEGNVHPDDVSTFRSNKHSFNLDFPPPAFIGDVDNAPVIILMLNGGYEETMTKSEFTDPNDRQEYIEWLGGRSLKIPRNLSPYYTQQKIFPLIRGGSVAIVNAVAYRSPKITIEKENRRVAKTLPSANLHRQWLMEEVVPEARRNKRLVVAHRTSLWDLKQHRGELKQNANFLFSTNPVSPYISEQTHERILQWLKAT